MFWECSLHHSPRKEGKEDEEGCHGAGQGRGAADSIIPWDEIREGDLQEFCSKAQAPSRGELPCPNRGGDSRKRSPPASGRA